MWKDFKVLSRFILKWIQPPACSDHGLFRSFLPIGWRTFIWRKKIRPGAGLFWFGLQQNVSDGTRSLPVIRVHCRLCILFVNTWRLALWADSLFLFPECSAGSILHTLSLFFVYSSPKNWVSNLKGARITQCSGSVTFRYGSAPQD